MAHECSEDMFCGACIREEKEALIQQRDKAIEEEREADEHRHSLLARLKETELQVSELREYAKATEYWKIEPHDQKERMAWIARLAVNPKGEILVCAHGAIHEIGWGICGKCQELGIPRRPERKPLIEKRGGPFLDLGEGEFINLYGRVVEKAKELLAEDNKTCGKSWPAGQAWDGLAGTSKSIFLTRARRALGVDDAAFLYTVRNWPYSDTAQSQMEYLFES